MIRPRAARAVVPLKLTTPPAEGELFVELSIDRHPLFAIVPQPGSEYHGRAADAIAITCSDECADDLCRWIDLDRAAAAGDRAAVDALDAERTRHHERILGNACAWCFTAIDWNAPGALLCAKLESKSGPPERAPGGLMVLPVLGRPVPGMIVAPDSEARRTGGTSRSCCAATRVVTHFAPRSPTRSRCRSFTDGSATHTIGRAGIPDRRATFAGRLRAV